MPGDNTYYNPEKAHEYYMKNRELKGYKDRYGGSRGDGTSAASTVGYESEYKKQVNYNQFNQNGSNYVDDSVNRGNRNSSTQVRNSTNSSLNNSSTNNKMLQLRNDIQDFKESLQQMNPEERRQHQSQLVMQIQAFKKQIQELKKFKQSDSINNTSKVSNFIQSSKQEKIVNIKNRADQYRHNNIVITFIRNNS